jgi:hypothetical protein
MELSLASVYARAMELQKATAEVRLGKERIRGAQKFKDATLTETAAFLRDFDSLSQSKDFSEKELAKMLENTCAETASFLFSAGAPAGLWRQWCFLASMSSYFARDSAYSMQLAVISRTAIEGDWGARLQSEELKSYREQAIQFVIFRQEGGRLPQLSPIDSLDKHYAALLGSLQSGDENTLSDSINRIAQFWLNETSYGRFEPGIYPVFEPEINAVVAALQAQGVGFKLKNAKIVNFLQAALE